MGIRMSVFLCLVVFALGAAMSPSAAADRVVVRAGIHQEFGRLVFDWPKRSVIARLSRTAY